MFVTVKCCVLFQVQTEFLNIMQMSFGFKGLNRGWDGSAVSYTLLITTVQNDISLL
jgi:hypothetical protein